MTALPTPLHGEVLPPHDVAAEEAVIAACLLDDDAVLRVVGAGLQPGDFYDRSLGECFGHCIALSERGDPITLVTLAHELNEAGQLDAAGGEPFLQAMVGQHFTTLGVEAHAVIVMRDSVYRRLIQASGEIARIAYAGGPDPDVVTQEAETVLRGITRDTQNAPGLPMEHFVRQQLEGGSKDSRELVTAGYPALNTAIRGLGIGELVCIGAKTNAGKSALMIGMALRQGEKLIPVGYLPIEGSPREVLHRMTAALTGVALGYANGHGWGPDGEEARYWRNFEYVGAFPIYMPEADRVPHTTQAIASWITRMVRQHELQVVYIDHIDHYRHRPESGQNTAGAYADSMRLLAETAQRERVAIVFGSQIRRDKDRTPGRPPPMDWLRESGAKEEASQTVLMLGRDEYVADGIKDTEAHWLHVEIGKLKDYVAYPRIEFNGFPRLYLDTHSGAVCQVGEDIRQ